MISTAGRRLLKISSRSRPVSNLWVQDTISHHHNPLPTTQSLRFFSVSDDLILEKKAFPLTLPDIMDAKDGKVTKWLKTEGDEFNAGDALCEMAVGGISIAYESDRPGVILEKLVNEGQIVPVGSPILNCAINKQAYLDYIDNKRIEAMEAERAAEAKEQQAESKEKSKKPDKLVLMREIKHLIQEGKIDEDSDFGKKLQSLARKGDANLMSAFEASFDGVAFNKETFDVDFFLDNAQAIVDESK